VVLKTDLGVAHANISGSTRKFSGSLSRLQPKNTAHIVTS